MKLTLDQLLAADVADFDQQRQAVLASLDTVATSAVLKSYSTSVTVQPAAEQLRAWLLSFNENMRNPARRLDGSLKARVCFAENGMKLALAYTQASLRSLKQFRDNKAAPITTTSALPLPGSRKRTAEQQDEETTQDVEYAEKLLRTSLRSILKQESETISMLQQWFGFVTYATPTHLKSIDTALTPTNVSFLDNALNA